MTTLVQTKTLVQVKAISSKLAKQIEVARDYKTQVSLIWDGLKYDKIKPQYWVDAEMIHENSRGRFWLVEHNQQLFWIQAPSTESELWKKFGFIEQLFVG